MATEKKVAFITGGNRGIGKETARQMGKQGVKVIIGSRDLAKGKEVAEELRADGADVDAIRFDITKSADYQEAYNYFDKNFGRLDILITTRASPKKAWALTTPVP
jgi:NAD(P)-dependent dehydrogenase (short-subunit alcohol dehydrogenase family)